MGLRQSEIPPKIKTLKELIEKLRNSVAHFDMNVISKDDSNLIDYIEFKDAENNEIIAKFHADELFKFLKYYSNCLLENLRRHPN